MEGGTEAGTEGVDRKGENRQHLAVFLRFIYRKPIIGLSLGDDDDDDDDEATTITTTITTTMTTSTVASPRSPTTGASLDNLQESYMKDKNKDDDDIDDDDDDVDYDDDNDDDSDDDNDNSLQE